MIEHPDADTLLAGPLGAWLAEQGSLRSATRAKAQRRFGWAVGAAMLATFGVIFTSGEVINAAMLGGMVGMGGFALVKWTEGPVVLRIKAGMNTAFAQALGLDYSTVVTDSHPFERARAFDLLPSYDNATTEDQWSGQLGGQRFCLHEARLTEERGSGKNRRTVTVFAGSLICVGFARPFTGITLIRRKAQGLGLIRKLFEGETITVAGQSLQRTVLADPRLGDSFEVWSTDQVEAHYLVNPSYVERLIGIEQAFAGEKLRAVFAAGELLIALESGDLFESGAIEATNDRQRLEQTITQFTALADMAVQLNERPR